MNMSCSMTKPTRWPVRPVKTQISLSVSPVWSRVFAVHMKNIGSLATPTAHSEGSDQTGRMPRLIWVFARCKSHFVGFVLHRHKYEYCSSYGLWVMNLTSRVNADGWTNGQKTFISRYTKQARQHTPLPFGEHNDLLYIIYKKEPTVTWFLCLFWWFPADISWLFLLHLWFLHTGNQQRQNMLFCIQKRQVCCK